MFNFKFKMTLLSPNIYVPSYTSTPKDYINIYINNSVNMSNVMEQRELEIPLDLWAPCLIHLNNIYHNRGARVLGCNSDNTARQ